MNNIVDLTNTHDRDANLSMLQLWHLAFYKVHPVLEHVLSDFRVVMNRYSALFRAHRMHHRHPRRPTGAFRG